MATPPTAGERSAPGGVLVRVGWVVVAAGALLRVLRLADDRSLWLDESLLGINLLERSPRELLHALDYVQSAPVVFLLAEKGALAVLGERELAMRILPFLASVAALVVFHRVAFAVLPAAGALLAVALLAFCEGLLYQSAEAKPYGGDVLVAGFLLLLALRALEADRMRERRVAEFTFVALVGVWVSFPAVFTAAAGFAALGLRSLLRSDRRSLLVVGLGALAVLGSFAGVAVTAARSVSSVQSAVFGGDAHGSGQAAATLRPLYAFLHDPAGFSPVLRAAALLCIVAALAALVSRRQYPLLVLLGGPAVLNVVASLADRYPLGGRFSFFLLPFLYLAVALGCWTLASIAFGGSPTAHPQAAWARAARKDASNNALGRRLVVAGLAALLVGPQLVNAVRRLPDPPRRDDVRPLLHALDREWRPGDVLYVYRNAQYQVLFYAECEACGIRPVPYPLRRAAPGVDNDGLPAALRTTSSVVVGRYGASLSGAAAEARALRGHRRLWLLFAHVPATADAADERDALLAALDAAGRPLASRSTEGASLHLYDTTR